MSQMSFKGLSALVTGGLNGLGRATAKRLSDLGCSVTIIDNGIRSTDEPKLSDCSYFTGDISNSDDVSACLKSIQENAGRLDALVNCAGLSSPLSVYNISSKASLKQHHIENLFKCNIIGCFNVIRLATPLIAANEPNQDGQRGVIVLNSGTQAFEAGNMQTLGASAARAVVGMTLPLSRELASHGIRVVSIAPGIFNTDSSPHNTKLPEMQLLLRIAHLSRHKCGDVEFYAHAVETAISNPLLNGCTIRVDDGFRLTV